MSLNLISDAAHPGSVAFAPAPAYVPAHGLLKGKRILVTAAGGSGIGSSTARRCLEEGATVLISDMHAGRLERTLDQLRADHDGQVFSQICDVTQEAAIERLYDEAVTQLGELDCVVNNAGFASTRQIVDMTDEDWGRVLDTSLLGTFRSTRAALRHLYAHGCGGSIVNLASVGGWRAMAGGAHYSAAKAGVMGFTRSAAAEAAAHNVRVNAVAPTMTQHADIKRYLTDQVIRDVVDKELLSRPAETWEVANVIVFLCSDYSSYVTGEILGVGAQNP